MSSMGHRHLINQSQMSEMDPDQIWNHPCPDPRLNLENGSFVLSSENVAVNDVNSMNNFNITHGSNGPPLSTFTSEIPNYMAIGTSHDLSLRAPSAASSSQRPLSYVQQGPPFYNQHATGDVGCMVNPHMDHGRASYKRKIPELSIVSDRGNASRYYGAGSASSLPFTNELIQPKPLSGPHCWPWDPVSMVPSYSSNVLSSGEGSQRNVRARHNHTFHVETVPIGVHASNNLPQHFHSAADTSGLGVVGQWSQNSVSMDPQRVALSSDVGSFNHQMNQSLAGCSGTNNSIEIDGGCHSNLIASRNSSTALVSIQGPPTGGLGLARSNYGQRTSYRAISSYPSVGFTVTSEDGRQPGMETVMPPRQPRPLTTIGRHGERNGRARNFYDRFQSFSDEDNNGSRRVSEGVAIMDRPTFYDSRNFFDQHHDMRLDIDNMSYEELLALGDRIGIVSTGLSEDAISRCLMEILYCSSKQDQDDEEELKCAICLEEYRGGESLGRLNCGHDFHASCIKQWLLIKNVCPICKASALEDTIKEK